MTVGIQRGVHQMVVTVNRAIIRNRICTWTVDSIKQTVVNSFATFTLRLIHSKTHEVVPKSLNAIAGKDTEDISLRMCELGRCVPTEAGQIFAEECLYSSQ
jgi:hypothetical protein